MFEEGQVNSLNLQELYGILPHHFLLSQLKLVEEEERWVINLKSIDHILNTPILKFGMEKEAQKVPGVSEVKLLKMFEWYTENPSNFHPLIQIATILAKLCEFRYIEYDRNGIQLSLYLSSYMLYKSGYPSLAPNLSVTNDLQLILTVERTDWENEAILDFANWLMDSISMAARNLDKNFQQIQQSAESKLGPTHRQFVFGKSSTDGTSGKSTADGGNELLLEELKIICQDHQKLFSSLAADLNRLDSDIKYNYDEKMITEKECKSVIESVKGTLPADLAQLSNLDFSCETKVVLSAPLGAYWRGKLPKNSFKILYLFSQNRISLVYVMNVEFKEEDPLAILPKTVSKSTILDHCNYSYVSDIPDIKILRSRSEEAFFQYLARLEQFTLKQGPKG